MNKNYEIEIKLGLLKNIEIANEMLNDLKLHIEDDEQVKADLEAIVIHLNKAKEELERY